jgi:hypothetical protein
MELIQAFHERSATANYSGTARVITESWLLVIRLNTGKYSHCKAFKTCATSDTLAANLCA